MANAASRGEALVKRLAVAQGVAAARRAAALAAAGLVASRIDVGRLDAAATRAARAVSGRRPGAVAAQGVIVPADGVSANAVAGGVRADAGGRLSAAAESAPMTARAGVVTSAATGKAPQQGRPAGAAGPSRLIVTMMDGTHATNADRRPPVTPGGSPRAAGASAGAGLAMRGAAAGLRAATGVAGGRIGAASSARQAEGAQGERALASVVATVTRQSGRGTPDMTAGASAAPAPGRAGLPASPQIGMARRGAGGSTALVPRTAMATKDETGPEHSAVAALGGGATDQTPAGGRDETAPQGGSASPVGGDVYLDGALMGRWLARTLADQAGRPASGGTGFDPLRGVFPTGAMIGG
jgi:hypothetical protein